MGTRPAARAIALLLGFCALLLPRPLQACLCAPATLEDWTRDSTAIFVGRAIESAFLPREADFGTHVTTAHRLRVLEAFKGTNVGDDVTVLTGLGHGDCGIPFDLGETRLVFAYASGAEGLLTTSICGGYSDSGTLQKLRARFATSAAHRKDEPPEAVRRPCPRVRPLEAVAETADVVFEGVVLSGCFDDASGERHYVIRADAIWKGAAIGELVKVGLSPEVPALDVGSEQLIFAARDGARMRADPCAGTTQTPEHLAALELLDPEERTRKLGQVEDSLQQELSRFQSQAVARHVPRERRPTLEHASAARCGLLNVALLDWPPPAQRSQPTKPSNQAPTLSPSSGGCAGCTTSHSPSPSMVAAHLLIALTLARCRRSPPRPRPLKVNAAP